MQISDEPVGGGKAQATSAAGVTEVDDLPIGTFQLEAFLGGRAAQDERDLRALRRARDLYATQFRRRGGANLPGGQQERGRKRVKRLSYHQVRCVTCRVIYDRDATISTPCKRREPGGPDLRSRSRLDEVAALLSGEPHRQIRRRQPPGAALGPFDEPGVAVAGQVAQAQILQLRGA